MHSYTTYTTMMSPKKSLIKVIKMFYGKGIKAITYADEHESSTTHEGSVSGCWIDQDGRINLACLDKSGNFCFSINIGNQSGDSVGYSVAKIFGGKIIDGIKTLEIEGIADVQSALIACTN